MTQHTKWQEFQRTPTSARDSALEELRLRLHQTVIADLGPLLYDQRASAPELRRQVQEALHAALADEKAPLSAMEKAQLVQDVTDDVLGYGPIDRFLKDPEINEVMVNGPDRVYVERRGVIEHTDVTFADETHLRRIIDKIVSEVGRRVDEATPMVDARLPDGSRVNVVVPPLSIGGPFLTIRRFSTDPYTVDDLVSFGTLTPAVSRFVEACVQGKLNMMISGGTGTGKTTLAERGVVVHPRSRAHRDDRRRQGAPARARSTCCRSSPVRRTSKVAGRSRSATSSATRCACVPTASSSVRSVAPRRSTCSRP